MSFNRDSNLQFTFSEAYDTIAKSGHLSSEHERHVWDAWLWKTPCNQPLVDYCGDMNLNQGFGLLICVALSRKPVLDDMTISQLLPNANMVHLTDSPIHTLTQRQLLDQVECLQLCWGFVMGAHEDIPGRCADVLHRLMARLGCIVQMAYPAGGKTLDAIQYTVALPAHLDSADYSIVTRKFIRRMCCIFLMLYRTLDITTSALVVPPPSDDDILTMRSAFREHHIECSNDFFAVLQQMVYLAPGMRLVYRMDFNGMYNDVSQVVFFHYPEYQRQAQLPLRHVVDNAVNCLPLLTQLMPGVPVVYDDDDFIPGKSICSNDKSFIPFAWLISCASIFLIEVIKETNMCNILASPDATLLPLLHYMTQKTGQNITACSDAGVHVRAKQVELAAHSHVELFFNIEH